MNVQVKAVTVNNITVLITEFRLKRKLSEVSDNHVKSEPPTKKAKTESPSKHSSPDKNAAKESTASSHRTKGSNAADKKSPTKGGKAKGEETSGKKRYSGHADSSEHSHQHSSSSKKLASVADSN